MRLQQLGVAATLLCFLTCPASAQTSPTLRLSLPVVSEGPYSPPNTRQFIVHSDQVGRDFLVVVSGPPPGTAFITGQKLPAIYALDGGHDVSGPLAQTMIAHSLMAPAYIVSVGYPEGQTNQRATDLVHRASFDQSTKAELEAASPGLKVGGGGAAFQAFLIEELRPFLEARYPLDPSRAILFGHSLGGLFTANIAAAAPASFAAYIVASPAFWADPTVLTRLASAAPNGGGRRMFVAAGGKELPRMLEGVDRLAGALAAQGSTFVVRTRVFPNEVHTSYYQLMVPEAFAWILPPGPPTLPASTAASPTK